MLYAHTEKGQGLVEYALIIAFIAVLLILALALIAPELTRMFSEIASSFPP